MPRSSLRRYLPDPQKLREHRALKPLGKWLQNPEIWHFHRRSVAGAAFIGLFVSFLPVPMHMLIAAAIAIALRCNLPLSVGLVWVNNPLTMGPLFFFAYKLGAWLLDTPPMVTEVTHRLRVAPSGIRPDLVAAAARFAGLRMGQRHHGARDSYGSAGASAWFDNGANVQRARRARAAANAPSQER